MILTIHRGTHQIGGCVTELRTDTTRILIDLGSPLPGPDGAVSEEPLSLPGVTAPDAPCGFIAPFLELLACWCTLMLVLSSIKVVFSTISC